MHQAISLLFLLFYSQFPIRFSWRYCLRSSARLNQTSAPGLCGIFYLRSVDFKTERLLNSLSLRPFSCSSTSPTAVYCCFWFCQLRYVVFYIRINSFLVYPKKPCHGSDGWSLGCHHQVQGSGSVYVANVLDKVTLRQVPLTPDLPMFYPISIIQPKLRTYSFTCYSALRVFLTDSIVKQHTNELILRNPTGLVTRLYWSAE